MSKYGEEIDELRENAERRRLRYEEVSRTYRTVFSSAGGQEVLADILDELGFNRPAEHIGDLNTQNAAKRILAKAGLWPESHELVERLSLGRKD